jgi:GT2 family glycosyltransferase
MRSRLAPDVDSLLQRFVRRTGRAVRRRRFVFHPVAERQVVAIDAGSSRWRSLGPAPALRLDPVDSRLPESWVVLDLELGIDGEDRPPVLRIDAGGRGEHPRHIILPRPEDGRVRTVLLLPELVHGLRLDPLGQAGEFRLGTVHMREIGKAELGLRRMLAAARAILRAPGGAPTLARRMFALLADGGLQALKDQLAGTGRQKDEYGLWVQQFDTLDARDVELVHARIDGFPRRPRISILMPVYDVPERWLRRAIESVQAQLYPDWQLCIADDASTAPHVRPVLEEYAARDHRITLVFRERNGHISAASNSALAAATGDFITLLDHDDELPSHALYMVAEEINACPDVDLIYSDEDKIDERGRRYQAYCKPDWDPDLFGSQNLVSHLGVYRTALVRRVDGFRSGFEGSQDYDLALRCMRETEPVRIRHIPYVLYHWRAIATSTAAGGPAKRYAFTAARHALRDHFARRDPRIEVEFGRFLALYRVRYPLPKPPPRVSIIVVTHDRLSRRAVGRLFRTRYPRMELLVVDAGVRDQPTLDLLRQLAASARTRVLGCAASSNRSASINLAAREARGTVLALLDPNLEPIDPDWLTEMVSHALRPEIGPVGARLLAPDDTVLHAGFVTGLRGIAENLHHELPGDSQGYFGRAQAIQGFTAVSGACLVVRREVFDRVGGFDEQNLPSLWNDVDFCLRARDAGFRTLWTPYAELRLVATGVSRTQIASDENRATEYVRRRWGTVLEPDPHFSPALSLDSNRPVLAWPPRRLRPWHDELATPFEGNPLNRDADRGTDDARREPFR